MPEENRARSHLSHAVPVASMIIPTYNSAKFLDRCLHSILSQDFDRIETIVVDNCSTDGTAKIAQSYGARVVSKRSGMSEARVIGAQAARGEIFFFIDSDMELLPSVVSDCITKIRTGMDALVIPERSVGEGFWARCKALEKSCYKGEVFESARVFRRDVYFQIGGHDIFLLGGEDKDLDIRVRVAGFYVERAKGWINHLEGRLKISSLVMKKYRYGKTMRYFSEKHPYEFRVHAIPFRIAFIRNWRKLVKDPAGTLGMFLMRSCEWAAAAAGFVATLTSERGKALEK